MVDVTVDVTTVRELVHQPFREFLPRRKLSVQERYSFSSNAQSPFCANGERLRAPAGIWKS